MGKTPETVRVKNKLDRVEKLAQQIKELTDTGVLHDSGCARLRKDGLQRIPGSGRVGCVTLNLLGKHNGGRIKPDLDRALKWWAEAISNRAKPRTVKVGDEKLPILIFTDGAHEEDEGTGYGGVMIDPHTKEAAGFGRYMNDKLKARLTMQGKKKQIIGQAELYPVICARKLWADKIKGRDVIHFVDNDSARCALIKLTGSLRRLGILTQDWAVAARSR